MAHRRTALFDWLKAALRDIPEFAGAGKVERGRTRAIPQEALPALTLTWADQGETSILRPCAGPNGEPGYVRTLFVSVIAHLRDEDPETEFDAICDLVEARLGGSLDGDGLIQEMLLDRTDFYVDPRTGLPMGAGRLVYRVDYATFSADPAWAGAQRRA